MNSHRSNSFSHIPTTEDLLNLSSTFVDIDFKHFLSHGFDLNEALTQPYGNIFGKYTSLKTFEQEIKFCKGEKPLSDNVAFKVFLDSQR